MKQLTIFDCIFALRSYILEVLPRLVGCWLNTPNYQENNGLLENVFRLLPMLKRCR